MELRTVNRTSVVGTILCFLIALTWSGPVHSRNQPAPPDVVRASLQALVDRKWGEHMQYIAGHVCMQLGSRPALEGKANYKRLIDMFLASGMERILEFDISEATVNADGSTVVSVAEKRRFRDEDPSREFVQPTIFTVREGAIVTVEWPDVAEKRFTMGRTTFALSDH